MPTVIRIHDYFCFSYLIQDPGYCFCGIAFSTYTLYKRKTRIPVKPLCSCV